WVAEAGAAYADLVAAFPPTPAVLRLVPRPTLAAAELDAALCRSALAALRERRWLPGGVAPRRGDSEGASQDRPTTKDDTTPDGGPRNGPSAEPRNRPTAAVVVDAAAPDDVLPGLLPADWSGRGVAAALAALEVRRLSIVDVVELVSGVDRPPAWWHRLYAALQHADRDALAGLPVPLADGRVVTGP